MPLIDAFTGQYSSCKEAEAYNAVRAEYEAQRHGD
jgi:hypothetical protein